MSFFDFLIVGGIEFMGTLTLVLIAILVLAGKKFYEYYFVKEKDMEKRKKGLHYIKFLGTLAVVIGVLGQVVGLIEGFAAIEELKDVSSALLAGGLKVSSYTTAYGLSIFVLAHLLWLVLNISYEKQSS